MMLRERCKCYLMNDCRGIYNDGTLLIAWSSSYCPSASPNDFLILLPSPYLRRDQHALNCHERDESERDNRERLLRLRHTHTRTEESHGKSSRW